MGNIKGEVRRSREARPSQASPILSSDSRFLTLVSLPGKTAPRLIQDLLAYNPSNLPSSGWNILTDPAPHFHRNAALPTLVARGSCRHQFMIKPDQSLFTSPGSESDGSTSYKVASFCQACRCHMLLIVDIVGDDGKRPCPNREYPLHHFVHVPENSTRRRNSGDPVKGERWVDQQYFRCSSPCCPVTVTIRMSAPRLTSAWVTLLTDKELVKERAQVVMGQAPERFEGIAPPLPINVLINLRSYLCNAIRSSEAKKIASLNKKFSTCFGEYGQPCRELLEYLGFTYNVWLSLLPESDME